MAGAKEPECTAEMIAAGVWALEQFTDAGVAPETVAQKVYLAMYQHRRGTPLERTLSQHACHANGS
jgi:hypothetical protein